MQYSGYNTERDVLDVSEKVDGPVCRGPGRLSTCFQDECGGRTFGPAVSEEYSLPVVFFLGGGAVADAYPLVVVESDPALVSGLRTVVLNFRLFFWGRSRLAWALARRVSEWIRRKLC